VRHLVLLASVYALVGALVLPSSLVASDEPAPPAAPEAGATETAAAEPTPATPAESPTAEPEPAPAPTPTAEPAAPPPPAEQQPAPPAEQPVQPAGQQATPSQPAAEQDLGDEDDRLRPKVRPVAAAAASTTVTIQDFAFSPKSITIDVGDTVTWRNTDDVAHSATAEDGSFDTGTFGKGASRSETFDTAGTFQYICTPHPFMKGTINVNAASGGGSGSDEAESGSGSGSGSDSGSDSRSGSSSSGSGSSTSGSGSSSDSGSVLPDTGADAATLAIVGLLMLALGAVVQRHARPNQR
jgi:LPXTG-motif cell wall-anchored protein